MVSIATSGILSDIPSDTVNLLAWNGGGKSNFSDIIKDGGYKAKDAQNAVLPVEEFTNELKAELEGVVEQIEKLIEKVY